jgi:hypothetical protein
MSWAIVRKGFDEPLMVFECQFADIEIPERFQGESFQLIPLGGTW